MDAPDILDSRYSWLRLGASLLIAMIGNAGMWVCIMIMPAVQAEFGLDRADAALPYTVLMIGFAVGNFVIGRIIDRFGITVALAGAAVLIAVAMYAATLATSPWLLIMLHVLIGFGAASCFGPLMADISQWFLLRRGIAVGITASGNYLSGAVWPLLLSGVLATHGWRAVYYIVAAAAIGLLLPLSLALRRRVPDISAARSDSASSQRASAAGLSPRALQYLLALAGIGCCVAMAMPQVHIVSLCVDMGFGPAVGSQMLALMLATGVVSRLVSGALADWLGGVRTVLIGSGLQMLALMLYLPAGGLVSLYVVSAIFGLSQGGIVPGYTLIVREYMPSREAGRRVGFVMMSTVGGMAIGGWMSGWIFDLSGGYRAAFMNGIGFNALNLMILTLLLLRTRTPGAPRAVTA